MVLADSHIPKPTSLFGQKTWQWTVGLFSGDVVEFT